MSGIKYTQFAKRRKKVGSPVHTNACISCCKWEIKNSSAFIYKKRKDRKFGNNWWDLFNICFIDMYCRKETTNEQYSRLVCTRRQRKNARAVFHSPTVLTGWRQAYFFQNSIFCLFLHSNSLSRLLVGKRFFDCMNTWTESGLHMYASLVIANKWNVQLRLHKSWYKNII